MRPVADADLHAFADGVASPDQRAEVLAYLDQHPTEARRVADWVAQTEALRRALGSLAFAQLPTPTSPPTDGTPESGTAALVDLALARKKRKRRRAAPAFPHLPGSAVSRKLTGVIGFAVVVGLATGWVAAHLLDAPSPQSAATAFREADSRQWGFAGRAIEAREVFSARREDAVEIGASDRARLAQWLQTMTGDATVPLPDLSDAGFALLGGRTLPSNAGAAALLLFQDRAGERLSLLVAHVALPSPHPPVYRESDGTAAIAWNDGARLLALAGAPERERLTGLAETVARSLRDASAPSSTGG